MYPGWFVDDQTERLVAQWLTASDQAQQDAAFTAVQSRALDEVAMLPLGEFFVRTAYRDGVKGVREGSVCWFWNVSKA